MFHPASLLLLWVAGVAAVQFLPFAPTLLVALLVAMAAFWRSQDLFLRLLKRSRWLFLTMGCLFLWLSPGIRLVSPLGDMGMTEEGLVFALEHMGRLLIMLSLLSLLLTRLSHRGIVSGFYLLMTPLGLLEWRRSLAVRLMLTLEAVAGKADSDWKSLIHATGREQVDATDISLQLEAPAWTWRDNFLAGGAMAAAGVLIWLGVR